MKTNWSYIIKEVLVSAAFLLALFSILAFLGWLILMAGTASAHAYDYPPKEYRHTPTVPYEIRDVPFGHIAEKCANVIRVETRAACQTWEGPVCVVYLPIVERPRRRSVRSNRGGRAVRYVRASRGLSWGERERLRIHELAHCNRWTHPVRGNVVFPTREDDGVALEGRP